VPREAAPFLRPLQRPRRPGASGDVRGRVDCPKAQPMFVISTSPHAIAIIPHTSTIND